MPTETSADIAQRAASRGAEAPPATWGWFPRMTETWFTRAAGKAAIASARAARTAQLIRFARAHSAFYRHAWRHLPDRELTLSQLPVATKRDLMSYFDDWVTDPEIARAGVESFTADRTHIGERYLGRYVIWKSSGSTGEPGVYVQDEAALVTYDALIALQLAAARLTGTYTWGVLARGGRAALIAATGDHFASIASWERVCRGTPWPNARAFSVMDPLPQLVEDLNAFQPAFLASYPTMLALLAQEQAAGRLRVRTACLWSGGEYLAPSTASAIERSFGCPLLNEYGASECMSIASGCREGWLHVNEEWVVLEPVDRDYEPVMPGEPSHTVLLTNLANRVQPIIRYDLGDSVMAAPGRCRCGNPTLAIRVQGRIDDVVNFHSADGRSVSLLPLALTTVVEDAADIHRFQLVARPPARLALRLDIDDAERRRSVAQAVIGALSRYLAMQSLDNVEVVLDPRPPVVDTRSGKLRSVIVERKPSKLG